MKTILILISLFALATFCYGSIGQIGLGFDLAGNHEISGQTLSHDSDVATGFSPSLELMAVKGHFLFGVGMEYQIPREVKFDYRPGKMGFIPFYGVMRFQIPLDSGVKPELIGQFGYNFITGDDDYKAGAELNGGSYWGLGAGLVIDDFVGQFMFKTSNAERKYLGNKYDIIYTRINLTAGFRF